MTTLSNNTFNNLYNYGIKGGTAVNFDCNIKGCELELSNNIFQNCKSKTTGGALSYTYFKPLDVQSNTFISNTANLYGNNICSTPLYIQFVTQEYYLANVNTDGDISWNSSSIYQSNFYNDQRSGEIVRPIYIGIFNEYGLAKENNVDIYLSLSPTPAERFLHIIRGNLTFSSTRGLYNISGVTIIATPGSNQNIVFTTFAIEKSVPYVGSYLAGQNKTTTDLLFNVSLRECIIGESNKLY